MPMSMLDVAWPCAMWGTTSCACVCVCVYVFTTQVCTDCTQAINRERVYTDNRLAARSQIHSLHTVYSIARGGARPWARLGDTCERLGLGPVLLCRSHRPSVGTLRSRRRWAMQAARVHTALCTTHTVICSLPVVSRDTVLGAHPHLFLRVPTLNPRAAVRGTRDANPKCARPRLVRPSALLLSRSS